MRKHISRIILTGGLFCSSSFMATSQIYSFEDKQIPQGWQVTGGDLGISGLRKKLGDHSLKITWQGKGELRMIEPLGIQQASLSSSGGINAWIYNEEPIDAPMVFVFRDKDGKTLCRLPFNLNFRGWRCLWSRFNDDLKMVRKSEIHTVAVELPEVARKSNLYFDHLEFTKNVSWQKMSDMQYTVNHKDFSLIHNFIGYRSQKADLDNLRLNGDEDQGIGAINKRLTEWYLGDNESAAQQLYKVRLNGEKAFIDKGLKAASGIKPGYNADGTPVGDGLYPLYAPSKIDGTAVGSFMHINRNILLPLALDYKKNNNTESLKKALYIYDWFNDQGWADGSGMGTLCFEKLRSSGYFHSFYLLKEHLEKEKYDREVKTMNWMTLFGHCYEKPHHAGEVADNLRALALPKLIYALSLEGKEQYAAMRAYSDYMNNALMFGPGFFGTIKADFSGYHHRGAYNSAYYPHALYAASLIAYLLHDTPYALSPQAMSNLKNALLTFRFFSANLSVPAATTGRFPVMQDVLQHLVPAFAYVALSGSEPDQELIAAMKRICGENEEVMRKFWKDVDSNLTYTASAGEARCVLQALASDTRPEAIPQGSLFMPYSGLMVIKNGTNHFNIKGFSRYIWDYECSTTENLYGRYLSYGHIEHFDLKNGNKSYHAANKDFDWNHIPGTTAKVLPDGQLRMKEGMKTHRSFSDETFLSGVSVSATTGMFSFKLHDLIYDQSFRAAKSVFAFDGVLMCLGSGINNQDTKNPTVTTLFQQPGQHELRKDKNGTIVCSSDGMVYAVKGDEVVLDEEKSLSSGYIDHGVAPRDKGYIYYIIPAGDVKTAKRYLSASSPVNVLRQDEKAHLVEHTKNGVVYGALFDEKEIFAGQPVHQVNIPLSFVLEKQQNGLRLSVCEPDMRRPSADVMDKLTPEDVVATEKPFDTVITLKGLYDLKEESAGFRVEHQDGMTKLSFQTIRGENYQVSLIGK